jgi:hypothetical protein
MCCGSSRIARIPAWILGCSVLDPSVEHLREAGFVRDPHDRQTGLLEELRGTPGREDLNPEVVKLTGEADDALLFENADQRASDPGAQGVTP